MSETNVTNTDHSAWVTPPPVNTNNHTDIEIQRKLYEEQRASEKQLIYEKLTASEYKGPGKERSAKMTALVAQHRYVI